MAARILSRQASPVEGMLAGLSSDKPSMRIWALMEIAKQGEMGAVQYQLDMQVYPLLEDPDTGVQEQALRTLSQLGSRGGRHCDLIARKLTSGEQQVKLSALLALGTLGLHAAGQSAAVEECLESQDLDLVVASCRALGGLKATSAAGKIAQSLGSDDLDVVMAACAGLSAMDRETDAVASLLTHSQPRVKTAAVAALRVMTRSEEYAQVVAPLVGDEDCYVRINAAETLCAWGEKAVSLVDVLGKYLSDANCGVVAAAATAIAGMGSAAASPHVALLEAALASEDEDKSTHMLTAAGVLPKVSAQLRKPACAAAAALATLGSTSAPKLVDRLSSKDWEIRAAAVNALSKLGADSTRFELQIVEMLKDTSPVVVASACQALGEMAASLGAASASTAGSVAELLDDQQPSVRASAAASLGCMGDEAECFLEPLAKLFHDKAWPVQIAAIKTVAGCGELGQMYASDVCRLIFDGNARVRMAACEALTQMGERGACFAEEVQSLLDDASPQVSAAAQKALEQFASCAPVPPLADLPEMLPALTQGTSAASSAPPPASSSTAPPPVEVRVEEKSTLAVGLLFPGQGSQYVKMLSEVKDLPAVKSMLETAQKILGYDILKLCLEGPEDQLENTKFCQPAMFIAGLAALELLRQDNPEAARRPQAVAGLSLGEYTALTVAGVFDFETGLKLVKLRGEAMQEAAEVCPQMMISVAGLDKPTLDKLCEECMSGPDDVCQVANFLFPNGFSCAGSKAAAEKLLDKALKVEGCLQAKPLKTSGAFHTKFMMPAREKLLLALREIESTMKPPTCEVYMNLTGQKIAAGTPPAEIIDMMGDQLTSCVLWEPSIKLMIKDGITEFYECGPMKQLKAMMKRIDADTWKRTKNIHV
eukprot:CAMPEP_0115106892 /NCGR_PEP_ID=MMETSP0227-20121206/36957_1 /TAXON_ID=89957 /ORGANISM="Polarella glacialis, Strain CCMP 1383" /LENGTH=880 /DNA_ID=CAMNT_0002504639 /DNA_START=58 /DNA_END=2700 /DNA_ORIENTATION=-